MLQIYKVIIMWFSSKINNFLNFGTRKLWAYAKIPFQVKECLTNAQHDLFLRFVAFFYLQMSLFMVLRYYPILVFLFETKLEWKHYKNLIHSVGGVREDSQSQIKKFELCSPEKPFTRIPFCPNPKMWMPNITQTIKFLL